MREYLDIDIEIYEKAEPFIFYLAVLILNWVIMIKVMQLSYLVNFIYFNVNIIYIVIILVSYVMTNYRHNIYDIYAKIKQKWELSR